MTAGKSLASLAIWLWSVALLMAVAGRGAPYYANLATTRAVVAPQIPMPRYLEPVTDPAFRTSMTRVTDPGSEMITGMSCQPAYCTHRYSSAQAWNADQSLLVIINGCDGFCFIDGQTYRPLFVRRVPNECEWHPIIAAQMICVSGTEIYVWEPKSDLKTTIYAPPDYTDFQFGPYKGNPSADGTRLVVRAANSAGAPVAFAYDIASRTKYPDIELATLPGTHGHCTIAPTGRFIVCTQQTSEDSYVYTLEGKQIHHWAEPHRPGHGDLTLDSDGSDVYVGISKTDPDKYHVIKRRLDNGKVTDLAPYGEVQHASMRNINRPDWVFLTYAGEYSEVATHPNWAPFYQEVVALRIDGSGEIRRIVQTRNERYDYWSETHASPSPDGSQIIWSSNWGEAGGPVADYVARLSWPATGAVR